MLTWQVFTWQVLAWQVLAWQVFTWPLADCQLLSGSVACRPALPTRASLYRLLLLYIPMAASSSKYICFQPTLSTFLLPYPCLLISIHNSFLVNVSLYKHQRRSLSNPTFFSRLNSNSCHMGQPGTAEVISCQDVDFNTVNSNCPTGKDVLIHSLGKDWWWENVQISPNLGRCTSLCFWCRRDTMFFRSLAEHYVIPEGIEGITLKQEKRQSQSLEISWPPALQDSSQKPLNKWNHSIYWPWSLIFKTISWQLIRN